MKRIILALTFVSALGFTAQAQPDPEKPLEAYTLFTENFRIKDYQFALPYGKLIITQFPKELPGVPDYRGHRVFDRMIKIYTAMADEQDDAQLKATYLDSAATLFNTVLDIYSTEEIDQFVWTLNRGIFYQTNAEAIDNGQDKAVADYIRAFEIDEARMLELGDGYYISVIVQKLVADGDRDAAIALMEKTESKVDEATVAYFNRVRDTLFRNPEERIEFLEGKFAAEPDNLELLGELFDLYVRVGNTAKVNEFGKKLYDSNPNFQNTMRMADQARANSDYRGAITYLEQAASLAESKEQKSDLFLKIADNRMNLNDLRGARDAARTATQENPNNGMAFFKIAEAYANAVSSCAGAQMGREDRVVYWLVLDYLDRAKRADPSLSNTINQQSRTYASVAPSAEDKFFMSWNTGDTKRVDGELRSCYSWINETTTVR